MLTPSERAVPLEGVPAGRRKRPLVLRGLELARKKPLGAISAVVLFVFVITALFANQLAPFDPLEFHVEDQLIGPTTTYWMGTDQFGRDVLSRVMFGARTSLTIGLFAVSISVFIGIVAGTVSGYFGGKPDMIIQRIVDVMFAFPGLLLLLALMSILKPTLPTLIGALAFTGWPGFSRIVRGTVLSGKENDYVLAAHAIGAPTGRILLRHVIPNVFAPIIIVYTGSLGGIIIAESGLSFLGLGIAPPTPTWGQMLSGAATQFLERAPWISVFTGTTLTLVVLSFNLAGDALRDILDPRLRGGR